MTVLRHCPLLAAILILGSLKPMTMFKQLFFVSALFITLLTASCSKDKKDDDNGGGGARKVVFKAETSAGGNVLQVSYGVDGDAHSATNINSSKWTSPEMVAPAGAYNANIVVGASGPTDATTLKVQIYVDGVLKKEESANPGKILSVTTGYKF